jgi:hypothetical protein
MNEQKERILCRIDQCSPFWFTIRSSLTQQGTSSTFIETHSFVDTSHREFSELHRGIHPKHFLLWQPPVITLLRFVFTVG